MGSPYRDKKVVPVCVFRALTHAETTEAMHIILWAIVFQPARMILWSSRATGLTLPERGMLDTCMKHVIRVDAKERERACPWTRMQYSTILYFLASTRSKLSRFVYKLPYLLLEGQIIAHQSSTGFVL
jgi:hypothetical protein